VEGVRGGDAFVLGRDVAPHVEALHFEEWCALRAVSK
jgi:hypothetical protein